MEKSGYQLYREWMLTSAYGQEKKIMKEIADISGLLEAPSDRIQDMLTAVSEAFLNAAEHGNGLSPDLPVRVTMLVSYKEIAFRIYDWGPGLSLGPEAMKPSELVMDKENPRGWGLYLIFSLASRVEAGWEDGTFYLEIGFPRKGISEGEH